MNIRPKIFIGLAFVSGIATGMLIYFKLEYAFFTASLFAAGMIGLAVLPDSDFERIQITKQRCKSK